MKIMVSDGDRTATEHFDPKIYEAFRDNHNTFAEIYDEYLDK